MPQHSNSHPKQNNNKANNRTVAELQSDLKEIKGVLTKENKLEARALDALRKEHSKSAAFDRKVEAAGGEIDWNTNHAARTVSLGKDVQGLRDDIAENKAVLKAVAKLEQEALSLQRQGKHKEAAAKLRDAEGRIKKELGDGRVSEDGAEFLRKQKIIK